MEGGDPVLPVDLYVCVFVGLNTESSQSSSMCDRQHIYVLLTENLSRGRKSWFLQDDLHPAGLNTD